MERRFLANEFEVRGTTGNVAHIAGYAAVFNRDSQPLGFMEPFIERIAPGAFKKTIGEADVRALFNHDPSQVLGRNKAGTLRLSEDSKGLHYEVDMDLENTDVRNVYRMIERGDVSQSSFGFTVVRDEWNYDDEPMQRTIQEAKLFDVGPVTYPAYTDTEVQSNALRTLSEQAHRPLAELVDAASRGELRSYLSTPGDKEPEATPEEPVMNHSEDREADHSMPPEFREALEKLDSETTPGAA